MTEEFKHNLNSLLTTLNSTFKEINNGGCDHFTLTIGTKLSELGYDVEGVCLQTIINPLDLDKIKEVYRVPSKELSQLNERGGYIHHLMLNVGGYLIDSTGIYNSLDEVKELYPRFDEVGRVSLDVIAGWCNSERWNPTFDTGQLPRMEHIINKYMGQEMTIMKRLEVLFG